MLQAFKQAVTDAFGSKKFLVFLATVITAAESKIGIKIDPDFLNQLIAVSAAYIVGQGIADHGKEAAKETGDIAAKLPAMQAIHLENVERAKNGNPKPFVVPGLTTGV